ncbi:MAG: hypothetical protein AMS22_09860 [Thiotrichales bacterium SG8_50]|nr:MAG: hypothetical protein AMS22_09860 [Thiotrichales bacterium SG8_50]
MNRFIRRTLYSLKRQYGGRVDVYKLGAAATDYETGVKTYTRTVTTVRKAIVLPVQIKREVVQGISAISANKMFVYGGTYDAGTRTFILDTRDLPDSYEIVMDDWLTYNGRRYDIKSISEFEQHTAWIIVGKEVKGVRPEQIIHMKVEDLLDVEHEVT